VLSASAVEAPRPRDGSAVDVLISLIASLATALISLTAVGTWQAISSRPLAFLSLVVLTFALQLMGVSVYGRGTISVSGIGFLAIGFTFGAPDSFGIYYRKADASTLARRSALR